jgi:3-keto-5-aminohexanoate cleavage enzyme
MRSGKLIINAAMTGMVPTKADNSAVPITPAEIEEDARVCRRAGAAIFHLHARHADGSPAYEAEIYREIVVGVRSSCPDAIICVSTSGRTFKEFDQRADVLSLDGDAQPEMASLTLGSLNFPKQASVNDPTMIRMLAERMYERGIVPEIEIFDMGMIDYAKHLIERKFLREPFYFNLLLGSLGTLSATPFNLATMVMSLPAGATWAGAGIGRFQFAVNSLAMAMGGNVRVGLEDNLYLDGGKQKPATNAALIERLARLANALEREVASPDEARAIIGLPARSPVAARASVS